MTTLVLEEAATLPVTRTLPTLESLIATAWTEIDRRGRTACPACGGQMDAKRATDGAGVLGACAACGSELS